MTKNYGEVKQEDGRPPTEMDGRGTRADLPSAEKARTYRVNFGTEARGARRPLDVKGLIGRGQITMDETGILLRGSRSRFAFSRGTEQIHIPLEKIFNVERAGLDLRFCFDDEGKGSPQFVQFKTAKLIEANQLLQQLPSRQTEAFAQQRAVLHEYHARLFELSPKALVTPVLVVINVLVFIAMCVGGVGFFSADGEKVVHWGSNFGPLTMGGEWWRLFTSLFVHFGVIHLALNMLVLLSSGAAIERLFGSARFLLLYLCAGLSGSMASLLWNPVVNSAGASGAIFGIFGGLLAFVLNPRNGVPVAVVSEQRNSVLFFAMYNLAFGSVHSGIDNAAHVGGLVGGFLAGFLLARPLRKESRASFGAAPFSFGLAGCLVMLSLISWPLVNPSENVRAKQQFQLALLDFGPQERRVNNEANEAWEKVNSNQLSSQAYASLLLRDVVPVWEQLYSEVSAPKLAASDSQFAMQQLLIRYADGRRRTARLLAQAILQNDKALMDLARDAKADADTALDELNKMNKAKS